MIAAFLLAGCGQVFYPEFENYSPDGQHSIAISRNWPERSTGYRYRVEIRGSGVRRTLVRGNAPATIRLVEVNWSRGGDVVRLFFCDGEKPVAAGFDFRLVRTLGPDEILPALESQIARRYGMSQSVPVVSWACSAVGANAYEAQSGIKPRRAPDDRAR